MSKKNDFSGVPKAVMDHYHQLKSGYITERNGVVRTEKHWSPTDEETMERLLTNVEITSLGVWKAVSVSFPKEKDQIKLFDAAWMARIDYDEYRFIDKSKDIRRKNTAKKLITEIKKHSEQLSTLLNQLTELGYRSLRRPDLDLNGSSIQTELQWLIKKAETFDPSKLSDEDFVNSALGSNKVNYKMEYLRGFISILREAGFPLEKDDINEKILVPLTTAAIGDADGGVSMNDIHNVIMIFRQK